MDRCLGWRSHQRLRKTARGVVVASVAALLAVNVGGALATSSRYGGGDHGNDHHSPRSSLEVRSLDGSGNNRARPTWGEAGTNYSRVSAANYADGVGSVTAGPNARFISNRVFNDVGQNLFSENNISQWGWAWGQFIDHDMGLRDETRAEDASVAYDANDPLESFSNETGSLAVARTLAAVGIGVTSPRQQVNTLSSYLDASNVYGVNASRLDWLRDGPVDGNPTNNSAALMLPGGYLPTAAARGNVGAAPPMDLMGPLFGRPDQAIVAGDVRANENIALTAIQTLFAREHNRIVAALPSSLSSTLKFEVARRVVGAEIQYITYNEFLPAMGVRLARYHGYNSRVNAAITNEFATVGFRAHSMVHGEFDIDFEPGDYSAAQLAAFSAAGIAVTDEPDEHSLLIPLSVAFGNPSLLQQVGLGAVLSAPGAEHQYKNDEQIDNTMRSVLFAVPKPGTTDPTACQTPVVDPRCFSDVADLGAADVVRGRDHGMASYNRMRRAFGLSPNRSFTAITGEVSEQFPADPAIDAIDPDNDPNILDFVELRGVDGNVMDPATPDAQEDAVTGVRRTTLASRLRAVYGSVDKVDAFVGMVSERHLRGSELGALQMAIWKDQFQKLRDGDRFFYKNDPALPAIAAYLGVSFRHSLAEIIGFNTGADVNPRVFVAASDPEE